MRGLDKVPEAFEPGLTSILPHSHTRYSNSLSGTLPTQLSRLTTEIFVYNNPCLYGTKVDVGGQNYDVSNTAVGSYAVPASCGVAVAMAPIKAAW